MGFPPQKNREIDHLTSSHVQPTEVEQGVEDSSHLVANGTTSHGFPWENPWENPENDGQMLGLSKL